MNYTDRRKAELLESIMAKHLAHETRTLADLRVAGFRFRSIESAWRRLKYQRQLAGFTQEQIDIAIKVAEGGR